MATAKKLPSGSWRCQVFSHFEEQIQPDGTVKKKRIYKSFTCDDPSTRGKRKCEAEAAAWAADKEQSSGMQWITILIPEKMYCHQGPYLNTERCVKDIVKI